MIKIAIIGGGASGLMAAITAATIGAQVTIIEHQKQIGKKLLSTGNGRCNFTNINQKPEYYHSENRAFPFAVYQKFPTQDTIAFFSKLGILSKNRNGYMYPHSDQATAVLAALQMEIKRLGIDVLTETKCFEIIPQENGFQIRTSNGVIEANKVILATGSKAAPVTGSDGSGYELAKKLGHQMTPIVPSLVQLRCAEPFYKKLAGIRINGKVELYLNEVLVAADTGEIQLTNYGISGIPVFQISRFAALGLNEKQTVTAKLDFMPDFTTSQLEVFLANRIEKRPMKKPEEFLIGVFPQKLANVFIQLSGLSKHQSVQQFSSNDIDILIKLIKSFTTVIAATNSFEQAQVCAGGVDTKEVSIDTLESLIQSGLYFAGELLDVDGLCGGYNLQWAWSSGYLAGREAASAAD